MARSMRRKDRMMDEDKAWMVLKDASWGTLSLASAEGEPYGVPVNYVCENRTIYIHCAKEGQKIDFLRKNSQAFFSVVATAQILPESFTTAYASVMASGKAEIGTGIEKREALQWFIEKYCPSLEKEGSAYIDKAIEQTEIIKFTIECLSGKSNL